MSEFVSGFLEYLKTQPELSKTNLLTHLQLLMDKATTYSWPSIRNFHLSVHSAVQNKRMSWSDYDKIREHAHTFFTHLDLKAPSATIPNTIPSRTTRSKTNKSCAAWNYIGRECSFDTTLTTYKDYHRYRICKGDHPMIHCKKLRYPIPRLTMGLGKDAKQSTD